MMPCAGHTSPQGMVLEGTCVMVDLSLRADITPRQGRQARTCDEVTGGDW